MGILKRVLRRTSRKLFAKIVPPGHSSQLVLNPTLDHGQQWSTRTNKRAAAIQRKLRKSNKDTALSEALLLAAKNQLPPVQFHHVHGPNAQLSKNKCIARRTQSFCQALVFSSRVILPNERVYIKVLDIAKGWSGTIRFGFTSVDPATFACSMPKHACPDMTNAGHTWARALADEVVRKNSVIHFSYNKNGFIHYGINNQDCGIFFANVNTNQNLWFIVDIYGLTSAIELIDPRLNNANSELNFSHIDQESGIRDRSTMYKSTSAMEDIFGRSEGRAHKKRSRRHAAALLNGQWPIGNGVLTDPLVIRFAHQQVGTALPNLNSVMLPAAQQNIYSPMPGELTQIRDITDPHDYYQINPQANAKPYPLRNSRLASRSTTNVSSSPETASAFNSPSSTSRSGISSEEHELSNRLDNFHLRPGQQRQPAARSSKSAASNVQTPVAAMRKGQNSQTSTGFKKTSDTKEQTKLNASRTGLNGSQATSASSGASASINQHNIKPKARHSIKSQKTPSSSSSSSARDKNNNSPPSKDCPICFERPINCVLYQCGHMCTCYECGVKQWRTQSRTCPICRTVIKDVIKTYMS